MPSSFESTTCKIEILVHPTYVFVTFHNLMLINLMLIRHG
jgi:hypothetical protein